MSELSPEARALIEVGREADQPTVDDRRRVRQALLTTLGGGVVLATTATAASAAAATTASTVSSSVSTVASTSASAGVVGVAASTSIPAAGNTTVVSTIAAKVLMTKVLLPIAFVGTVGSAVAFKPWKPEASSSVSTNTSSAASDIRSSKALRRTGPHTLPRAGDANPGAVSAATEQTFDVPRAASELQSEHGSAAAALAVVPPPVKHVFSSRKVRGDHAASLPASPVPPQEKTEQSLESETPSHASALTLGSELQLLRAAQDARRKGQYRLALDILEEHAETFHAGALASERAATQVLVLCDMGEKSEARAAAEMFLWTHTNSPLVGRIRNSCAYKTE